MKFQNAPTFVVGLRSIFSKAGVSVALLGAETKGLVLELENEVIHSVDLDLDLSLTITPVLAADVCSQLTQTFISSHRKIFLEKFGSLGTKH